MALGNKLEELRKSAGMTQDELALRIGFSQKTISSWETSRTYPRMRDIQRLCDALGCTIETLTESRTRDIGDITFDDMLVKLQELSIEELQKIQQICAQIIQNRREIEAMEEFKQEQMKKIAEYEKRIRMLKAQIGEET